MGWYIYGAKRKKCQQRILYLAKLSFKNEGDIKIFPDKQKTREFIVNRPASPAVLKRVLQGEIKRD